MTPERAADEEIPTLQGVNGNFFSRNKLGMTILQLISSIITQDEEKLK